MSVSVHHKQQNSRVTAVHVHGLTGLFFHPISVLNIWCWLLKRLWCSSELYFWANALKIVSAFVNKGEISNTHWVICQEKKKHLKGLESLPVDYQMYYSVESAAYFQPIWSDRSIKSQRNQTTTVTSACFLSNTIILQRWNNWTTLQCFLFLREVFQVECVPNAAAGPACSNGSSDSLISWNWDNTVIPNQSLPAAHTVAPLQSDCSSVHLVC